jgi:hypothetical protein
MTMHVEHGTIPATSSLLDAIWAKFKAWRAQRIERAQIEALEACEPGILENIGARHGKAEIPPHFIPVCNPYGIVAAAVFAPRPRERDEL